MDNAPAADRERPMLRGRTLVATLVVAVVIALIGGFVLLGTVWGAD